MSSEYYDEKGRFRPPTDTISDWPSSIDGRGRDASPVFESARSELSHLVNKTLDSAREANVQVMGSLDRAPSFANAVIEEAGIIYKYNKTFLGEKTSEISEVVKESVGKVRSKWHEFVVDLEENSVTPDWENTDDISPFDPRGAEAIRQDLRERTIPNLVTSLDTWVESDPQLMHGVEEFEDNPQEVPFVPYTIAHSLSVLDRYTKGEQIDPQEWVSVTLLPIAAATHGWKKLPKPVRAAIETAPLGVAVACGAQVQGAPAPIPDNLPAQVDETETDIAEAGSEAASLESNTPIGGVIRPLDLTVTEITDDPTAYLETEGGEILKYYLGIKEGVGFGNNQEWDSHIKETDGYLITEIQVEGSVYDETYYVGMYVRDTDTAQASLEIDMLRVNDEGDIEIVPLDFRQPENNSSITTTAFDVDFEFEKGGNELVVTQNGESMVVRGGSMFQAIDFEEAGGNVTPVAAGVTGISFPGGGSGDVAENVSPPPGPTPNSEPIDASVEESVELSMDMTDEELLQNAPELPIRSELGDVDREFSTEAGRVYDAYGDVESLTPQGVVRLGREQEKSGEEIDGGSNIAYVLYKDSNEETYLALNVETGEMQHAIYGEYSHTVEINGQSIEVPGIPVLIVNDESILENNRGFNGINPTDPDASERIAKGVATAMALGHVSGEIFNYDSIQGKGSLTTGNTPFMNYSPDQRILMSEIDREAWGAAALDMFYENLYLARIGQDREANTYLRAPQAREIDMAEQNVLVINLVQEGLPANFRGVMTPRYNNTGANVVQHYAAEFFEDGLVWTVKYPNYGTSTRTNNQVVEIVRFAWTAGLYESREWFPDKYESTNDATGSVAGAMCDPNSLDSYAGTWAFPTFVKSSPQQSCALQFIKQ